MSKFLKVFGIILVFVAIFSTVSFAGFEDISGHWCEKEIVDFNKSGFVDGYADGTFRPDDEITKAELCKIINSYMNYEVSGEWQEANMEMAKEKKYLTTGKAEELISREEAFVAFAKLMKLDDIECELQYQDSGDISVWAVPAIKSLTFTKYIAGNEENLLKPKQNITRAEVVKVLYGFVGIGGVDEDIEEEEFAIGYLSHNKYGLEFIKIEDVLEIESGETITLSATVSGDDEVEFKVVSGKKIVDFDAESLKLEAVKSGKAEVIARYLGEKKKIIIKVK